MSEDLFGGGNDDTRRLKMRQLSAKRAKESDGNIKTAAAIAAAIGAAALAVPTGGMSLAAVPAVLGMAGAGAAVGGGLASMAVDENKGEATVDTIKALGSLGTGLEGVNADAAKADALAKGFKGATGTIPK